MNEQIKKVMEKPELNVTIRDVSQNPLIAKPNSIGERASII